MRPLISVELWNAGRSSLRGDTRNFTTSYTYDKASNRTGFTDPENGSTTYAYDTLNRLQTLTPPSAFTSGNFGFGYDALSRRTSLTRPNSVATNYAYDNLSRLQSVLHQLSGSTIDGATYTVDNAGNRSAKTDQRTAVTTNYGYDNIYELLSATQGGTTTESYTYDPVGNRLSSLGVSSYTNNTSNELTSTSNATYTYDYNGNLLTKVVGSNTTTYAWDFENRMTSVTLPGSGGTVSFKYDPFGRRIYKSSSSVTSVYAYDRNNLVEETNSTGAVVARYSLALNIDEPLAMLRSGATSFYHADGLGSITSLTNGSGSIAQSYTFDSFGNQTASSGSLTNPFRYTAREFDSETSLYYYRARYHDPQAGRFLGEDETGFHDGVNFYRYAHNDPIDNTDPTGYTTYKGFPADKEVQLRNAVDEAIKKLSDTCSSGHSCAGADGPKLINLIQNATFVFQPNSKDCGQTGPATVLRFRHTFGLGPLAFEPICCSLASTLVHEAVHGLTHPRNKRPQRIEKDCFGCTVPEKP